MAESAIDFVLQKFVAFLDEHAQLLEGLHEETNKIKDELVSVRGFLRKTDEAGVQDDWVNQVREVAYDIEDVLEKYTRVQPPQHQNCLTSVAHKVKHLKLKHDIAKCVQVVQAKVVEIDQRNKRYKLDNASSNSAGNDESYDPEFYVNIVNKNDLVGIEKPRNEFINRLKNGSPTREVFSVVGPGGMGKSTLVGNVYDCQSVKEHFPCRAWIEVPQTFNMHEILRNLSKKLRKSEPEEDIRELVQELQEYLRDKRYVVVFDNMWKLSIWSFIEKVLCNNECGSRIIITTRKRDIAFYSAQSNTNIIDLQPMSPDDAMELFCKKAFALEYNGECPPDLQDLSVSIVRKCGGSPLAVTTIGCALLRKPKTKQDFKVFYDNLASELRKNETLEPIMQILSVSYQSLPWYLKSCFMYFGLLPEDYGVWSHRLSKLWVVEGFIEPEQGKTLEEVAEVYVDKLISRSLVQIDSLVVDGEKICRVHDIMREFINSRFSNENLTINVGGDNVSTFHKRIRRLSIINNGEENVINTTSLIHIRSLLVFGSDYMKSNLISKSKLLRVLDLRNSSLKKFPKEVLKQLKLKYLDLSGTNISIIPKSLGKLRDLELLNLSNTLVLKLPVSVLKLRKLRHLLLNRTNGGPDGTLDIDRGVEVPDMIVGLKALQTLSGIEAKEGSSIFTNLENLSELRTLNIKNLRSECGANLCNSIENMKQLRVMHLSALPKEDGVLELQSLKNPPLFLKGLNLRGRLEMLPAWIPPLTNLITVALRWSRLNDDPLPVLGDLPKLQSLWLLDNAYIGDRLYFGGKFESLRNLEITRFDELNVVVIEQRTMPLIEKLQIANCKQLKEVPSGIEYLAKLKSLHIIDMPEEFQKRLAQKGGEDYQKVRNIPKIIFRYWRDETWVKERIIAVMTNGQVQTVPAMIEICNGNQEDTYQITTVSTSDQTTTGMSQTMCVITKISLLMLCVVIMVISVFFGVIV